MAQHANDSQAATLDQLRAAYKDAQARARSERTPEAMDAAVAAWAAMEAAAPRRKCSSYGSRAGQRQAAERRAMYGNR